MASLFKPTYTHKASGKLKRTKKWYGKYRTVDGRVRKVPLSANKDAARQMLGELIAGNERERVNGKDPHAPHRAVPLADHLAAYHRSFADRGHTDKQATQVVTRCRAVFDGCGFALLSGLDAEAAQAWLADRRKVARKDGGFGAGTSNQYVSALKAFGNWCVRTKRVPASPFHHLAKVNAALDVRHARRDLSSSEFDALTAAARVGTVYRRQSGPDRVVLYHVAGYTGLRSAELASLTPGSFAFDATPPTLTVEAAFSKHKRRDVIPLHPDLVALLRPWVAARPASAPLWPGKWAKHTEAVDMIRRDLSAARAAWIEAAADPAERERREAPDFLAYRDARGRVADFHSLRHTFITKLVQAGVLPKDAKELARHSTITLTMDRYAHTTLQDTAAAVAKLNIPAGTSFGTSGPAEAAKTLENKTLPRPVARPPEPKVTGSTPVGHTGNARVCE